MKNLIVILSLILSGSIAQSASSDSVAAKTKDAANEAIEYSKAQRDEFQKEMEKNLASLKSEIKSLQESAKTKTGEAKKSLEKQITALESKQEELSKDLAKLKKTSGRAWSELKDGVAQAWDTMKESYGKAKEELVK